MSGTGDIGDKRLHRFRKRQGMKSNASDNDVGLALEEPDLWQH
jgi:hypothetical protein